MSTNTKIERTRPAHPETDRHVYLAGDYWHLSAPPNSRPLEPCRCIYPRVDETGHSFLGLVVSDEEVAAALREWHFLPAKQA